MAGDGGQIRSARSRPVRVLLVDDHPALRAVIRVACERRAGLQVVGESSTGHEAVQAHDATRPDVLVLDLQLPGLDGLEVIRRLRARGSDARILVLSDQDDPAAVFDSIRVGADGYVHKSRSAGEIAEAVEALASGEQVFTLDHRRAALTQLGLRARRSREAARAAAALTRREREILALISDGLTNRQVGSRLGVSTRTIESHVSSLYRKLGVTNRIQAAQIATTLRLVPHEHGVAPSHAGRTQ